MSSRLRRSHWVASAQERPNPGSRGAMTGETEKATVVGHQRLACLVSHQAAWYQRLCPLVIESVFATAASTYALEVLRGNSARYFRAASKAAGPIFGPTS